jgi:hypothetical protein
MGLLDEFKTVHSLAQMRKIQKELAAVSQLMSPFQNEISTRPLRVLWEIVASSAVGAATAPITGSSPSIGAAIGALGHIARTVPPLIHEMGPALFGHGAFDLAKRIRKEIKCFDYNALAKLLTDSEKQYLGV